MEIRVYRPQQDFKSLLEAQCDLYKINFARFQCTAAFLAEQSQRLRIAGRRPYENGIFVLDDLGIMAGFIWVAMRIDLQGPYGSVDQVYLKPGYRNQGFGKQLMARAEQFIFEHTVSVSRLYVTVDNKVAVRLYENNGYRVIRYEMEKIIP